MIKKIFVVVLVSITIMSYAQEGTSSPYSFYGLGIQKFKGTVENRSMGGLSILADSIHVNLQNPASFANLELTTYAVGTSYRTFKLSNDADEVSYGDNTSLDYLAIGIPAGKLFGLGFGVVPLTSVGYDLTSVDGDDELIFSGFGGVNKVFVSTGFKINENLSVCLDLNYNFGTIEKETILSVADIQYGTREINNSVLSAFNLSFGLRYQDMISDKLEVSFSAVSIPSFDIDIENTRELATVILSTTGTDSAIERTDVEVEDDEVKLPAEYKLAAGIGSPRHWFMGVEYNFVDSSEFENLTAFQNNAEYKDASKYRIGGYFIPKYNSLTSYFSRAVYRAGFRYEETGLSVNDTSIDEFGISFGVGLPVGRLFSNANIGLEYGQRGTIDSGLVRESFFNVSIGLSLNDKWFRKIKFN